MKYNGTGQIDGVKRRSCEQPITAKCANIRSGDSTRKTEKGNYSH